MGDANAYHGQRVLTLGLSTEPQQTSFTIESYGVVIRITLNGAVPVDTLKVRLPPGWQRTARDNSDLSCEVAPAQGGDVRVKTDKGDARVFQDMGSLLDWIEHNTQHFVAEHATPHLFVHAGVVAWNGSAILLPARSFAGKSTLVTSLVKAGATYYSDEYAVLDLEGRVLPYPRQVSLRDGPHGPAGRLDLSAHAPQGDAARIPIPVGLVALLRYDEAVGWDVADLGYLPAIMAMAEQTVAIQRRARDAMEILGKVAGTARVIQGTRGDVDDAVKRLLALLDHDGAQRT
jgi:hypothetical protein